LYLEQQATRWTNHTRYKVSVVQAHPDNFAKAFAKILDCSQYRSSSSEGEEIPTG
jgi:hypothetical protein